MVEAGMAKKLNGVVTENLVKNAIGLGEPGWRGTTREFSREASRKSGGTGSSFRFFGKWQRDMIPSQLAQRDLDNIGQRVAIQDARDGIAHVEHQHAKSAVRLIGARAFRVGGLADAANRRQWSVDQSHDFADRNLAGQLA